MAGPTSSPAPGLVRDRTSRLSAGAELDSFFAYSPSFSGGVRVGVSDFNADGRYDITTVPGSGTNLTVNAFDGPTQQAITAAAFTPFASTGGGFVGGSRF